MIPIRLLTKLFVLETEEMPAEMRAQRQPNNTRIKKLAAYVLEKEYVLSSVTVTVELSEAYDYFQFEQVQDDLGMLKIPMESKMLIADGQHRIYGLQRALKEDPDLGDETISCVIFLDFGLERRQQIFHDLNNFVSKPTKSLNLLYDHRSDGAEIARNVMNGAIIFRGRTDAEKTSLAAKSLKAFTFNAIDEAVNKWMHPGKDNGLSAAQMSKRAIEFFKEVTKHIPEWQWLIDKEIAPGELRAGSMSCNAVTLCALGYVGSVLLKESDWNERLAALKLGEIEWAKSNTVFENVIIFGGRIHKNSTTVKALGDWILSRGTAASPEKTELSKENAIEQSKNKASDQT